MLSLWAKLRALVITLALLIQLGSAIPSRALQASAMAKAEGQRVVSAVQRALAIVGVAAEPAAISHGLIDATERAVKLRNRLLSPFEPWFHHTQTHQQWRLFINPKRECFRIHVEAREKRRGRERREWALLYRASDVDRLGLSNQLRYRRLRGIYNPNARRGVKASYGGFANWLAAEVLARQPEAGAVRVRMERLLIGPPGANLRSLGFEHVVTLKREAVR
jgi:hypothetical protein